MAYRTNTILLLTFVTLYGFIVVITTHMIEKEYLFLSYFTPNLKMLPGINCRDN